MAGGLQYVKLSDAFGYTSAATSEAVGYPLSRATDWTSTRPLARTWRSTATTTQVINFNFGGLKNGTWLALLNVNFTQVQIAVSGNGGSSFTDIVTGSGTLTTKTISKDWTDPQGYYKYFLATPYTGKDFASIVIPSQTPTDNAGYFSIGLVAWGNSLTTMSQYFHDPLGEEYIDPEYRVEGKDWTESTPAGISYRTLTMKNIVKDAAQMQEWHAVRLLKPHTRVLWYANQDNSSEVELRVRNQPARITRHGVSQEIDTGFRSLA